jgi:uncharacterized coiled-coil protein SlyX
MNRKRRRVAKATMSQEEYITYLEKTVKMQRDLIDRQIIQLRILKDTLDEIEAQMKALTPDV